MKKALLAALLLSGCVDKATAVDYARRAHPECTGHRSLAHRLSETSKTEVEMKCDGKIRTVAVKCEYGFGIFADTTCHENN